MSAAFGCEPAPDFTALNRCNSGEQRNMETRTSAAQPAGEAEQFDYTPKKMTPRQTLVITLKLAVAAAAFMGLLWLAHVRLEK